MDRKDNGNRKDSERNQKEAAERTQIQMEENQKEAAERKRRKGTMQ